MTVFINKTDRWQGHGPNYQRIHDLCHDLDREFFMSGMDGCVCFDDREILDKEIIDHIQQTNHEIYLVLTTEFDFNDRRSASGKMYEPYALLRKKLNDLASTKKIILASSLKNAHLNGPPIDNLLKVYVPGAAMMIDHQSYCAVPPVKIKNFNSTRHWVSLNRTPHHHRSMMAMTLLGHNLAVNNGEMTDTGLLHIGVAHSIQKSIKWEEYWGQSTHLISKHQKQILDKGFRSLREYLHGGQPDSEYLEIDFDKNNYNMSNPKNFDQCLRHIYQDSVIEIINDTTYYNPSGTAHNEKYVNAVMGMNLPLILSNINAVQEFRELGFDVFDDILDHSYDTISDPIERMFALVERNLALLQSRNLARQCWIKSVPRLLKNVDRYHDLYDHVRDIACINLRQTILDYRSKITVNT